MARAWTARCPTLAAVVLAGAWSAPAAAREVLRVKPEQGFDVVTADVGGFVQPRFVDVEEDKPKGIPGEIGFQVRRARMEFSGKAWNKTGGYFGLALSHKVSIELMPEARLVDAYVNLRVADPIQLRWGQLKTPTSRSMLTSDRRTLFPDRGEILDMTPRRDMGAMLHGFAGKHHVEYQLGMFNGEGTNRLSNVNRKFLTAGRVVVSPIGGPGTSEELLFVEDEATFSIGYSFFRNTIGAEGQEEATLGQTIEAFAHWRYITAQGEYLWRTTDAQVQSLADYKSYGWYAQAGVFPPLIPWVEDHIALIGKYEEVEEFEPTNFAEKEIGLTSPDDPFQARNSTWFGIGIYAGKPLFESLHDLRLNIVYGLREELENLPYANDELQVAAHFSF